MTQHHNKASPNSFGSNLTKANHVGLSEDEQRTGPPALVSATATLPFQPAAAVSRAASDDATTSPAAALLTFGDQYDATGAPFDKCNE